MAFGSLVYRGSTLQTTDGTVYTFSGCNIGAASDLRAVLVFVGASTLSSNTGAGQITSLTINGYAATSLNYVGSNTNQGLFTFIAYVPTGNSVDIVVNTNIIMTRVNIVWYTLKPTSIVPQDLVNLSSSSTATDVSFTDIDMTAGGVVVMGMVTNGAPTFTISYNGIDSYNADLTSGLLDGNFYMLTANIKPTETIATRDVAYSGASMRHYGVAISFAAEAKFEDTVAEVIDIAPGDAVQWHLATTNSDGVNIVDVARHTPIVSISDTLSDILGISDLAVVGIPTDIADAINFSDLSYYPQVVSVADSANFLDKFKVELGAVARDTVGMGDVAPSYYYVRGAVVSEAVGMHDMMLPSGRWVAAVTDRGRVRDVMIVGLPVTVSESMAVQFAAGVARGLKIIDRLGLSDLMLPNAKFGKTFTQTIGLHDGLLRFFSGDVVEGISVYETAAYARKLKPSLVEGLGLSDTLARKLIVRVTAADTVDFDDSQVLQMLYGPTVIDGVELAAGYVSPNGNITTWAINTRTTGATEYTNYAFNSFAQMGTRYLGAMSDGLYELDGNTDAGTNIIADIKSGLMQLGGSRFTSFKAAYLGMRGSGDFVLKLETGDGKTYNYAVIGKSLQTSRVHFGKGLRARYFSFELISTGQDFDLDSIEFIPLVAQRRV